MRQVTAPRLDLSTDFLTDRTDLSINRAYQSQADVLHKMDACIKWIRGSRSIRQVSVEHILAASEKVFAQHGFEGATMAQLAAAAGLPKANLHYYFGTKERLYRAVLEGILGMWLDDAAIWIMPEAPSGRGPRRLCPRQDGAFAPAPARFAHLRGRTAARRAAHHACISAGTAPAGGRAGAGDRRLERRAA